MKFKWIFPAALTVLGPLLACSSLVAESTATRITPFYDFRNSISNADSASYLSKAEARVQGRPAFEEMRQHLLTLYAGVDVGHSFLHDGDVYDCIPIMQQPSVRLLGITKIADPPPPHGMRGEADDKVLPARQLAKDETADQFGNSTNCEVGTISMRRITLEEMARFSSLKAFLSKSPSEGGPSQNATTAPCTGNCPHKYSITYQYVANHGGHSGLNLWSPYVKTAIGEIFSLSQQWYIGGAGASTQTVEVGWQNFPAKYGNNKSRLFIFYTPNNYRSGCYNLDCAGFVQINNSVHLGGGFANYSTSNGPQYSIPITVELYQGNWWMYYGNTAFGYYPTSLYQGGAMAYGSSLVEYGSESVQSGGTYPGEGSGAWSSAGFGWAAYQRYIWHYDTSNSAIWDSLSTYQPSPSCYSITGPYYSTVSGWGIYFYEGGPGGKKC